MSDDSKYLYVDENLHFVTGDEAERALRDHSDAAFLDPAKGVVRVPKERWRQAQKYERDTWLVANAGASDDRNVAHEAAFGGYAAIESRSFQHAIELGCGPFTNLRIVARHCRIERCSLLDPLIREYLNHPHCTYDEHALRIGETALSHKLGTTQIGRALRRVVRAVSPALVEKRVAVAQLLPMPIEEMPSGRYDLVVMINVLEHCFDATVIFQRILEILPPGGVLVFHDKLFEPSEIADDVRTRFDAGHPLRVGRPVIEAFVNDHFTPLYRRAEKVADEFDDIDLTRDGIYFIGERNG
ncbi:MAG TPA: class I SAM-dependent methyltransferase [Thermoanaerobaculia bacterium]|jgi:SAM-dependent methyltransferase